MTFPFISLQCYKLSDARGVVSEALRVPSYCKHVNNPKEPSVLFSVGYALKDLPKMLRSLVKLSNENSERRLRKDAIVFVAGAASFPVNPEAIEGSREHQIAYAKWKLLTLEFLKEQFQKDLFCVIEHTDERFAHLHFFVTPKLRLDYKIVCDAHPGRNSNLANQNLLGKEKQALYRKAMSAFLDLYFKKVGSKMGWQRKSPTPRKRVSREQWKEQHRSKSDVIILQQLGYSADEIFNLTGIEVPRMAPVFVPPKPTFSPKFF